MVPRRQTAYGVRLEIYTLLPTLGFPCRSGSGILGGMARPPCIEFADAVYHVTSRGNGRAKIFWSEADRLRFLWTVPLDEIDSAVARHDRIDRQELQTHGHHAGSAKVVAVELACRLSGLTQRAIGRHYGRLSASAVCAIHRKVREEDQAVQPSLRYLETHLMAKRRLR